MTSILLALLAVILLAVGLYGYFRWFGVLDRPEGERYQRRRMQGPFVPVVDEYDERDERRPRENPRD